MKNETKESTVGRPTLYNPKTMDLFYGRLADGLPVKSACVKAGIGVSTLADWREKYPEVEAGIERARDVFREKAFKTIRAAVDSGSWQAAVQALKLVFVEYRGEG